MVVYDTRVREEILPILSTVAVNCLLQYMEHLHNRAVYLKN